MGRVIDFLPVRAQTTSMKFETSLTHVGDKMKAMRNKKGRLKLRWVPKQTNVGVSA